MEVSASHRGSSHVQPGHFRRRSRGSLKETNQTCLRGPCEMQLTDKVIIITGGCQGLGRSMAEYFAAKGVKLALVDLNQEKLDDAGAA